jgi:YafQ family addiction module toxin component
MYNCEINPELRLILNKLSKKDKVTYDYVFKKIDEIANCSDVDHYKNLTHEMKDRKRVHIGNFVLVFKHIKSENKIYFVDFDHHDNIYGH